MIHPLIAFVILTVTSPAFAQQNGSNADYRYQSNPDFRPGNSTRMARESVHRSQALRGDEQRAWVDSIDAGCGSNADCRYRTVAPVVTVPTFAPTYDRGR